MRSSVCPALSTAAIVHGLSTDHVRRPGQRCTVLTHPVSLIHRGKSVQINRATSSALLCISAKDVSQSRLSFCLLVFRFFFLFVCLSAVTKSSEAKTGLTSALLTVIAFVTANSGIAMSAKPCSKIAAATIRTQRMLTCDGTCRWRFRTMRPLPNFIKPLATPSGRATQRLRHG